MGTVRRMLRDYGLTLVLAAMFLGSIVGQTLVGHAYNNDQLAEHGKQAIGIAAYMREPVYLSSLFENWESEFLQMSTYVVLTAFLFQRGSSESRDPDEPPRDERMGAADVDEKSPSALRGGAVLRWIYSHSLGLALFLLFVGSFIGHWWFSAKDAASEAQLHGRSSGSIAEYLTDPQLWFESFQNWQSEFMSTAVLVVLSIYLRQKGSPESKPVGAPHDETGA